MILVDGLEVAMAGRKIVDEREARSCLEAVAASGEGRATWARQHGIDGRSLNAWRINLERAGSSTRWSTAELRLVELVASSPMRAAPGCRVRCGSFVVEVDADFDDEVLARLLTAVAAC